MTRGQDPAEMADNDAATIPSSALVAYNAALEAGQFRIQRCGGCSRYVFYPRIVCPHCASADLAWVEPAGTGTVYSTTIVRRSGDKGGSYNVALIDLDEGVRLMSRVEGVPPELVRIGMRVSVSVATVNGAAAPVFRPLPAGGAA